MPWAAAMRRIHLSLLMLMVFLLTELSGGIVRSNDRPDVLSMAGDHVFWTTIFGKIAVRSSACLAMRAATLRAMSR